MIRLDLDRAACPFAAMRAAVEAGEPDQPVEVWHDGKRCLTVASLHRGACLTTQEEPGLRFVPYTPHPRTNIGPRVSALLEADRARRAAMLERSKKAVSDVGR
jgi:hypothetical protein